jgi:NitT/TauT family transport system substrate-binding protein
MWGKRVVRIALVVPALVVTAACGDDDAEPEAAESVTTTTEAEPAGETTTATRETLPPNTEIVIASPPGAASAFPEGVAEAEGILAAHNIRLERVQFTGGPAAVAGLVSGSIDVTASSPVIVANAIQQGNEIAFFCGGALQNPGMLLVTPESDLQTVEELGSWEEATAQLSGLSVGVPALGGEFEAKVRLAVEAAGVDPSTVAFVAVGIGPSAEAALTTGQIDVLAGVDFFQRGYLADGIARELGVVLGGEEGPESLQDAFQYGYVASRTWLDENPVIATEFCAAVDDAVSFLEDPSNTTGLEELLVADFGLTPAGASASLEAVSDGYYSTEMPQSAVEKSLETLQSAGLIPATPPITYNELVAQAGG